MNDIILLKQGEVVLKGLNKRYFEQKLLANIRKRLKQLGNFRVYCVQSTVYVEPEDESADMDAAFEAMRHVFGIIALTRAAACEKNEDAIFEKAREYLKEDMENAKSFKVETRRSDKSFQMTSIQLSQYVGGGPAGRRLSGHEGRRATPGAGRPPRSARLRSLRPRRAHAGRRAACLSAPTAVQ